MSVPRKIGEIGLPDRAHSASPFADDVQYYLMQHPRQLPSRYLYDELGSALFDAICRLPWYSIPRAETRLLRARSQDIFARLGQVSTIVELGPGNGDKLRLLVDTGRRNTGPLTIHLVDVSPTALTMAARTLADLDETVVVLHEASYEEGLNDVARRLRAAGRTLALFLGSNIGNFDQPGAEAVLRTIRGGLGAGDGLLLGVDLVKPERQLLLAYDDPLGVTAAFNRNLLVRINRELGSDFDVEGFAHRAVWNGSESRVEMHLVSRTAQRVRIAAGMEVDFAAGEMIWTESSYKYRPDEVVALVRRAGFRPLAQWVDAAEPFALTLAETVSVQKSP